MSIFLTDAFFTCRKNALLPKSTSIDGLSGPIGGKPSLEEKQALLQQWLEKGAGGGCTNERASEQDEVSAISAVEWQEGPKLLMTSLSNLIVSPQSHDQEEEEEQQQPLLQEVPTEGSSGLQEFVEPTLASSLTQEKEDVEVNAPWAAVRTEGDLPDEDAALSTEVWIEDPAVLAWSPAQENDVISAEAVMWPFADAGQFQPLPLDIPYHGKY